MSQDTTNKPTKHTLLLDNALKMVGVETVLEHFDGHKYVDIFIPKGKIYIEIDGMHHYTSAFQLATDFALIIIQMMMGSIRCEYLMWWLKLKQ